MKGLLFGSLSDTGFVSPSSYTSIIDTSLPPLIPLVRYTSRPSFTSLHSFAMDGQARAVQLGIVKAVSIALFLVWFRLGKDGIVSYGANTCTVRLISRFWQGLPGLV